MEDIMDKVFKVLVWIADRVKEPSTWAGGGLVAVSIHTLFPGVLGDSIIAVGVAVGGLLAIVMPETPVSK